ncbi:MAG: hypothetical protein HOV77_16040 [Hamadaea sp.]|uniref:hypothetical protein n=1 Tax=Hamadaea sp. TaxID=2024425 RepID=UPI0017EAE83F|nr:hypothetical protein [Hamadaea sp.]NUT20694.1 hypothetical protein [Hamadaea sp.]
MNLDFSRRAAATVAAAVLLLSTVVAQPASAADDVRTSSLRLCDPTGCYVAWRVVDSDHDGVCDADELMAGTDPYDPTSRPGLKVVVEIARERKLPSFENGLGVFLALPQEIIEARGKAGMDVLGAFDMASRHDTLHHFSLTFGEITTGGVDLDPTRGFSLGLAGKGGPDSKPGLRVGGVSVGLIAAGFDEPQYSFGQEHGGVKSVDRYKDGGSRFVFNDGASRETHPDGQGGFVRTTTNPDDSPGPTTTGQSQTESDGEGGTVHREKETTTNPNDDVDTVVYRETHDAPGGGSSSMTTVVQVVRDENGDVTGTYKTTIVTITSADGEYSSSDVTIEQCDNSDTCTVIASGYEDSDTANDETYYNPDADTTIITFEMQDNVLRTRGAAVKVMNGWAAPGFENDPANPHDPGLIGFIDSDLQTSYLLVSPPRVTKAQPEGHPGLPQPGQAAPRDGGCGGYCG